MLEEHHRVGIADGGLEQPHGVRGRGRADDLDAGGLREPPLGVLRVEGPGAHAAAGGQADDDRAGHLPAVEELGRHVDELVEAAGDEVAELHLDHRPVAEEGGADGDADRAALGDRRVEHPVRPAGVEALGGAEGAFEDADVLPHQHHRRVALHLLEQRLVDGVHVGASRPWAGSYWTAGACGRPPASGGGSGAKTGRSAISSAGGARVDRAGDGLLDDLRDPRLQPLAGGARPAPPPLRGGGRRRARDRRRGRRRARPAAPTFSESSPSAVAAHAAEHGLDQGRPLAGAGAGHGAVEGVGHGVGIVAVHRLGGDAVADAAVGELARRRTGGGPGSRRRSGCSRSPGSAAASRRRPC